MVLFFGGWHMCCTIYICNHSYIIITPKCATIDILYRNDNINGIGNDDNIIRLRSQENNHDIQTNDVNVKDKGEASTVLLLLMMEATVFSINSIIHILRIQILMW